MLAEVVHRIAHSEVILHRIERQLTAAWTEVNNQTIDNTWGKKEPFPDDPELIEEIGTSILGKTALGDAAGPNTIGKITRYYAEFERIWSRAFKQYNQIRKEAKATPKLAVVHEMPGPSPADQQPEPPPPDGPAPPNPNPTQTNPIPSADTSREPGGQPPQAPASSDYRPQPHENPTQTNPTAANGFSRGLRKPGNQSDPQEPIP